MLLLFLLTGIAPASRSADAISLKIRQVGLENVYPLGNSPILIGMLYSRWQRTHLGTSAPPAHFQAPPSLNPYYRRMTLIDGSDFRSHSHLFSSRLLFAAIGCLAAAFAMRRLPRSGEQV